MSHFAFSFDAAHPLHRYCFVYVNIVNVVRLFRAIAAFGRTTLVELLEAVLSPLFKAVKVGFLRIGRISFARRSYNITASASTYYSTSRRLGLRVRSRRIFLPNK